MSPIWKRKASKGENEELGVPPMSRGVQAFSMVAFFVLGGAAVWLVVANPLGLGLFPTPSSDTGTVVSHEQGESGEVLYQCPMHIEVIENEPGACPICGMDLIALTEPTARSGSISSAPVSGRYSEAGDPETSVIQIDPAQVQNIGVVSVEAAIEDIKRYSRTVGILDFNAENITWVNTKFDGWVEKAHVSYVGQEVRRGQPLFEIYSPQVVTTKEEYVRALEYRASLEDSGRPEALRQAESLVRSTRDRLGYWDIDDEQVEALESSRQVQRRLTVTSRVDGIVAEVMSEALEGMFVKPGMNLYKIADLSTVWVHADIFELDIPWIRDGQPAIVSFHNDPEKKFRGKVLFLYPEVSSDTRALKICIEVPNPERRLRPGMYADVLVLGPPVKKAVVVPQSAILRSGERNIVFLDLDEGKFSPREVELGVKGEGDLIEIVRGVEAGERVVTQAQFMLDSESRIQEAIARFRQRAKNSSAPVVEP